MDKRTVNRFEIPLKLDVRAVDYDQRFNAYTKDISMKGIRMLSQQSLNDGTILDLRLCFPNIPQEEVLAKVLWTKKKEDTFESGCVFINMPDYIKEDIYTYMTQYFPNELRKRWWM